MPHVVRVVSGLGNRLLALATAVSQLGADTLIVWTPQLNHCECMFSDILQAPALRVAPVMPCHDAPMCLYAASPAELPVAFTSCTQFLRTTPANLSRALHRYVRPSAAVREMLDAACRRYPPSQCIGLHVRRGDKRAQAESAQPLSTVLAFVQGHRHLARVVVVATDDDVVFAELRQRLNGLRVVRLVSDTSRSNMAGAALDMFFLAQCRFFFGCKASTFSRVIRLLRTGHSRPARLRIRTRAP